MFATYLKKLKGTLKVYIFNISDNTIEAEKYVDLESVEDNKWINVEFPVIPNTLNKQYKVVFKTENDYENGLSVYLNKEDIPCMKVLYRDFAIYDKYNQLRLENSNLKLLKSQLEDVERNLLVQISKLNNELVLKENISNELLLKESINNSLNSQLRTIFDSQGWKLLLRIYRIRDWLFPGNSKRKKYLKSIIKRKGNNNLNGDLSNRTSAKITSNKSIVIEEIETNYNLKKYTEPIDIIVCVHNALEDVKKCMESITMNTNLPYNLIVVDDGSSEDA